MFHITALLRYFVATTKFNTSPAMVIELLTRLSDLCKDYCGVLTEESIRLNFVLVYEILDEAIDFGYGQTTATEQLKSYATPLSLPHSLAHTRVHTHTHTFSLCSRVLVSAGASCTCTWLSSS
jgi:hypothetical protein